MMRGLPFNSGSHDAHSGWLCAHCVRRDFRRVDGHQLNESVSLAFGKIESSIILNGTTFNSCFDIQSNSNC
jgi:hypothetical protein